MNSWCYYLKYLQYNPWTCQQRDAGSHCSHQRDFGLLSKLFLRPQVTVMTLFTHSISAIGWLFCKCYACRKQMYFIIKFFFCDVDIYPVFCFDDIQVDKMWPVGVRWHGSEQDIWYGERACHNERCMQTSADQPKLAFICDRVHPPFWLIKSP